MKDSTTDKVAIMLLNEIEVLHKLGYIHRSISPDKFRVKDGKIYITDLSTVIQYRE